MKKTKVVCLIILILCSSIVLLSSDVEYGSAVLNRFISYSELKQFVQTKVYQYSQYFSPLRSASRSSAESQFRAMWGLNDGFSKTNIQVEGVDEADYVKTDGQFIYVLSGQNVCIIKAYPAEDAAILSRITFNGTLKQLFINAERLVVFYVNGTYYGSQTVTSIFDISNKTNPLLQNTIAVNGEYFASRMIGNYVYVIVRRAATLINGEIALPKICFGAESKITEATDIYYSSTTDYGYAFTTIVSVNVQEDWQEPKDQTILSGWTTNVYVSLDNIYLALGRWENTLLHRIHIENGEITYAADGQVSGTILNQFSMDEYGDYFRIATTSQPQTNNLYILNVNLETVSSILNIAPREQIHSARFMGDKCYLVTFKKIDPLFVIDLTDPHDPEILGALKVTGYSDYLHVYDVNHVIGIGKETIEEGESFAWYQGVKISLFDVTDVLEPKELAKYEVGNRGTDSPVLSDHKAFLFDKEKNLLVIPVTVAKIDESQYSGNVPPYAFGQVVGQGVFIFRISLDSEEKIVLRGNITHIENGNVYDSRHYITRTLYIGEVLYTISTCKIKINSLLDLSEINELTLNN